MIYTSKCPQCGGSMVYNGTKKRLHCPYCENQIEIVGWESGIQTTEESSVEEKRHCAQCGAVLEQDEGMAAKICPYCGNTNVFHEKVKGERPFRELVPFRITKQECKDVLRKRMKTCFFAPRDFRSVSTLEHVAGVYIPYYLFDVGGNIQAEFQATKVHSYVSGDEEITVTKHYAVYRELEAEYEKVPLDGLRELDDNKTHTIEPFPMGEAQRFAPGYLMGYEARVPDVTQEEAEKRIHSMVESFLRQEVRDTVVGYTSASMTSNRTSLEFHDRIPAMMPVWFLHYRFHNKDYDIMMNGQTGKLVGKFPMSWLRVLMFFGVSFAIMSTVCFAFLFLI